MIVVMQVRVKLQQCAHQWADYNSSIVRFRDWLWNVEKTMKDLDLKSSLAEKQQQLQNVEVNFLYLPCKIRS